MVRSLADRTFQLRQQQQGYGQMPPQQGMRPVYSQMPQQKTRGVKSKKEKDKEKWWERFQDYGKKWIILFLLGFLMMGLCWVAWPLCIVGILVWFMEVFFFFAMVISGIMALLAGA